LPQQFRRCGNRRHDSSNRVDVEHLIPIGRAPIKEIKPRPGATGEVAVGANPLHINCNSLSSNHSEHESQREINTHANENDSGDSTRPAFECGYPIEGFANSLGSCSNQDCENNNR